MTFVDHRHQVVMNGSQLGKAYSLKGLGQRLGWQQQTAHKMQPLKINPSKAVDGIPNSIAKENLWEILLKTPEEFSVVPLAFKKRKKRRIPNHSSS